MKVLVFSDIHLDAVTAGSPRRAEIAGFLRAARAIAKAEKVDLAIFSGDAHDSGWLLDPLHSAELITGLLSFEQPLVAIAGNHDVVDTSELFAGEPVTTLTPVRAAAGFLPEDETFGALAYHIHVLDRPRFVRVADWGVLGLPYVSRAHSKVNAEWLAEAFAEAEAFGGPLIVVAHLVVPGAVISSESIEMAKGQDQLFPIHEVARLGPAAVINGHYHTRQVVKWNGISVLIPGSPLRFTFGEADQVSKGVLILDL